MKGLITGIKRMAIHDGAGVRTTVFFKGCPLNCIWCHNPEDIHFGQELAFYERKCIGCGTCTMACPKHAISMCAGKPRIDKVNCLECGEECTKNCPTGAMTLHGESWDPDALAEVLLQDQPFYDASGGGVTLSGGECLAQPEFATELAKILYEKGISVDIDTCGYASRNVMERIVPYVDTFLYDLKAVDPDVHRKCTGKDNTIILDNLRYLSQNGCNIEIRYPYVKNYNDGECTKIATFLQGMPGITKVKVLGYHSYASAKYDALGMKNTLPNVSVSVADVDEAVAILRSYGLNAVNGMRDD